MLLISSTESLFQGGNIITAENLAGYLNLTFFEGGEQIPFNIEVNNDQTEIEIDPAISLVDYQWQDVVITFSNQNVDGDSLTDEASNLIQSETKNMIKYVSSSVDQIGGFHTFSAAQVHSFGKEIRRSGRKQKVVRARKHEKHTSS